MSLINVLLVDDEHHVVESMSELLKSQEELRIEIFTAESAEEAIYWLEHTRIDLMITDVEMPGMDGLSLVRILRERWPSCRTIVLTAYPRFDYAYQAIKLGITDYVLKTESDNQILEHISRCIQLIQSELQENTQRILRDNITDPQPSFHDHLLKELLTNSDSQTDHILREMGFDDQKTGFCTVLMVIHAGSESVSSVRLLLQYDILSHMACFRNVKLNGCDCYLLQPSDTLGSPEAVLSWIEGTLEQMLDALLAEHMSDISVALSPPTANSHQLPAYAERAFQVLLQEDSGKNGFVYILPDLSQPVMPTTVNDTIQVIRKYILEHMSEDISLHRLAEVTCFNASYLSRSFHKITGTTLNHYIAELKLIRIRELMGDAKLSLNEIAERTGFDSRSYFNRFINRMTGESPQKYREHIQEKSNKENHTRNFHDQ